MRGKKVAAAVGALALVLFLSACGGGVAIKGTVGEVIDQCQSVDAGEEPVVEVTGYVKEDLVISGELDGGELYVTAFLGDSPESRSGSVVINLNSVDQETVDEVYGADRITAKGTVYDISSEMVCLKDCEIISSE